ncbi:MAG: phosphoribosyltransferase [Steroidobacteraceae bacterium]
MPLFEFPDIVLHADEFAVKRHAQYRAAKAGDILAAAALVGEFINNDSVRQLRTWLRGRPVELVPIHALESGGVNEIPEELAKLLSRHLGLTVNRSIVQSNSVGHTGASGFQRLAHQAIFIGEVRPESQCFLVDDFVGQGGTLANLIGFIASRGSQVLGATVLTGKPYSAKLAPDKGLIQALRDRHGPDFEQWWQQHFGFGFNCLTRSEARYLEKSPDAHTIRDRLAAAGFEGSA